ncbi:Ig-like domain-containing protein [Myxococcota bacterium]|nr:Ig-like domain-containing protein [Myxococcota bacterium]
MRGSGLPLLVLAVIAGCGPDPEVGGSPAEGVDDGATASASRGLNQVLWTSPEDGAQDAYIADPVRIGFRQAETEPDVLVTAGDQGVAGRVEVSADGLVATFWPDGPLFADTLHSVTVAFSGGVHTFTFRTSAWGQPLSPGADVAGTYAFAWADAEVAEPASFADLLGEGAYEGLLIQVSGGVAPDSLDLLVARSGDGSSAAQALCTPTARWDGASFDAPPFVDWDADPGALPARAGLLRVHEATFDAVFDSGAAVLGEVRLAGLLDLGPLGDGSVEAACAREEEAGGAGCVPCPDDGGASCLPLEVRAPAAPRTEQSVLERTLEQVAVDPNCADSTSAT